jgi:hypothetical protein
LKYLPNFKKKKQTGMKYKNFEQTIRYFFTDSGNVCHAKWVPVTTAGTGCTLRMKQTAAT